MYTILHYYLLYKQDHYSNLLLNIKHIYIYTRSRFDWTTGLLLKGHGGGFCLHQAQSFQGVVLGISPWISRHGNHGIFAKEKHG